MRTTGRPPAARRRHRLTAALATLVTGVIGGLAVPGAAQAETVREAQYWLDTLGVLKAQQISKGEGITVAVIDGGVDAKHPDLAGAVVPGTGMPGTGTTDGMTDRQGHGTKMASLIAGRGGNGPNHALGIAPRAKVMPIAIPYEETALPGTTPTDLSAPIRYAADHGAKIINLSLANPTSGPRQPDIDAIAYARSKGVIVVAAGGNRTQGDTKIPIPGSYDGVITVAGTMRDNSLWSGSLPGDAVDIAAPAEETVGAAPYAVHKSGYAGGTGTSGATAIVSGVLALIWSKYPSLDAANVVNRLFKTASDKGAKGKDQQFGHGLIDPVAALSANVAAVGADPLGPITSGSKAPGAATPPAGSDKDFGTPAIRTAIAAGVGLFCILAVALAIILPVRAAARRRSRAAPPRPGHFPPPGAGPPGFGPPGFGPPGPGGQSGAVGPPGAYGASGVPGASGAGFGPPGASGAVGAPGHRYGPPAGHAPGHPPAPPGGGPATAGWQQVPGQPHTGAIGGPAGGHSGMFAAQPDHTGTFVSPPPGQPPRPPQEPPPAG